MKALMVWDGDYPWDVRVEKVCKTLIDNGDEVYLVSRNSAGKAREEAINGLQVRRVFSLSSRWKRLNAIVTFPFFLSPFWLHEIYKQAKAIKPDIIIIRDLPMALGAILVAKLLKIPTVLDMAECYPEMLRCIWKFEKLRPQNLLVRNPYLADIVEYLAIKNVDLAWVMIEESAARLVKKGVPEHRIKIVSNTPVLAQDIPRGRIDTPTGKLSFVYVGLLNPSRGLRTVIEAADRLRKKTADFEVVIAGSGKDMPHLKGMVEKHKLEQHVNFMGWVDHKALGEILEKSDVGIVPHYVCSHWDNTIPNKLFDYMKSAIPVLVSNAKPTERIANETQCGLVYINDDPDDLAEKMFMLFDGELRKTLGKAGETAVKQRYQWNNDAKVLLQSAAELATNQ